MEIFTLVTGVIYIILEIRQKNLMWVVGVVTSLAAMYVFFLQGLYGSFGLNLYYFIMSFWGLWTWKRQKDSLSAGKAGEDAVHLNRMTRKVFVSSMLMVVFGTVLLAWLMRLLDDPMSYLDAAVAVLSAVATWWLGRSYLEQWWLWILADMMSAVLCLTMGMWWMTVLYVMYALSAVYGLYYWKRKGVYLN